MVNYVVRLQTYVRQSPEREWSGRWRQTIKAVDYDDAMLIAESFRPAQTNFVDRIATVCVTLRLNHQLVYVAVDDLPGVSDEIRRLVKTHAESEAKKPARMAV